MFIDQAKFHIKSGDGGPGCISFRREKYVARGGPNGGDGGKGGDVWIEAAADVDTLIDYLGRHIWKAKNGLPGEGSNCSGKDGDDLVLKVPVGTLIYDEGLERLLLADMAEAGMKIRICRGGIGGHGNSFFANSVRQTPRIAQPGKQGKERDLYLELKLIADVGLVGLPNAGKSTLVSRCSAARPKIADYPFTTLEPVLGIVELSGFRRFLMADLPGLIEGAHSGAGLGHDFLKHIERTRIIVHMLELSPSDGSSPVENYEKIRNELVSHSAALGEKREVIVINKTDLDPDGSETEKLKSRFDAEEVFAVSAVSGKGIKELCDRLWRIVKDSKNESEGVL
ncbi:MAG: GTPase ObgE [Anaerohalosphaeraceae bacterium]|nr:GTPase ObgE [Anaerohalosphaeraceae bacterium]